MVIDFDDDRADAAERNERANFDAYGIYDTEGGLSSGEIAPFSASSVTWGQGFWARCPVSGWNAGRYIAIFP